MEFIKATPYWEQWSFPIFKEREENVKMKAILEADKKNLTDSVLTDFVLIVILVFHGLIL